MYVRMYKYICTHIPEVSGQSVSLPAAMYVD